MKQIEQYRVWEVEAPAGASATLEMAGQMETVSGFAAGESHLLRWMPMRTGIWRYTLRAGDWCETGELECLPAKEGNHGPVQARDMAFVYADGTANFVREYTLASGGPYCDCGYKKKA